MAGKKRESEADDQKKVKAAKVVKEETEEEEEEEGDESEGGDGGDSEEEEGEAAYDYDAVCEGCNVAHTGPCWTEVQWMQEEGPPCYKCNVATNLERSSCFFCNHDALHEPNDTVVEEFLGSEDYSEFPRVQCQVCSRKGVLVSEAQCFECDEGDEDDE
eukprot:comp20342_c0_seq1/m.25637 comp20342_c0_seq1/g.25637  ORF comp20342_c0_seq1/g.25637 comp20342_c0_seq1/m.25637 type:complete len:159 (-) comp20342_c0_seq1:1077-1553(-)